MKEENGPLIALVLFILLSIIFGYMAYNAHAKLVGDETIKPKAALIKETVLEIEQLKSQVEDYQKRIVNFTATIKEQENRYNYFQHVFDTYSAGYSRRQSLQEIGVQYEAKASELGDQITQQKNETITALSKNITTIREEMERDVASLNEKKDTATANLTKIKEDLAGYTRTFQGNKNYQQAELGNSKSILSDLTQRDVERADVFSETDAKVIFSDPIRGTVVVDIGSGDGVKNGYRFEVFALRPGNKKVSKAYVEVRRVFPTKSECYVIRKLVALPRDPLSEYVAKEPEELYSPYQEKRDTTNHVSAQPLSAKPRLVVTGPPVMDPIVEGDLVQNPFFAPGKTFTFYIAGSKKIENDRQKSAIRYRWTEIKNVLESYGGKLSPNADPTVHYIIAQKNPGDSSDELDAAEYKKAKDLGLPVIYEWELFRFLENK